MFTPYIGDYGYGWVITEAFGHKVIMHARGLQGFVAVIARFVEDDVVIILLCNVENTDFSRHWCPESEKITGGDALISMIRAGWRLDAKILRENCFLSGIRQTTIYHIRLNRDGQTRQMHVLCNPYITRLLSLPGISIEDVAATH